ncbi:bacterial dnaA family protein [Orientia chuto str. Dubai]|uniref:Bacterial dnaA family protein n=1 Tax=Orientia chuto str. Dubai TaxID=1359168 RepID=A0A0F3MHC4_9RICK|nr:cell division protein ZapE [Candidatus Orientia mediorientalis]KJV55153.1 bacterial dnaA family protein [Orientia chuto str. Dubai]
MDIKSYFASEKKLNPSQEELVSILQAISNYFHSRKIIRYFCRLPYHGTYIYGKVGSGKTMLMQALNQSLEKIGKSGYFHYQFLMHSLHKVIRQKSYTDSNLVKKLAYEYSSKYPIMLIDEFEITDIAEALLIGSFFKWLFIQKVYIVLTSNIAPENLYNNGLKRELFLPYIDIIKQNMQIFHLQSNHDYRKVKIQSQEQRILVGQMQAIACN